VGQVLKGVQHVAVVEGEVLAMEVVLVILMFPNRQRSGLLHLYL